MKKILANGFHLEQAWQATNGRPTKLQLAKITEFGKCRLAKGLPPRTFLKIEGPKLNTTFPTTSPGN